MGQNNNLRNNKQQERIKIHGFFIQGAQSFTKFIELLQHSIHGIGLHIGAIRKYNKLENKYYTNG